MVSCIRMLRVVVTLGVGLLIFTTLQWMSGTPASISSSSLPNFKDLSYQDAKERYEQAKSGLKSVFSGGESKETTGGPGVSKAPAIGPGTGWPVGYVENAHQLQTADDFIPHMKAVVQLPGISMNTAKAGCNWENNQRVNFQYDAETSWAKEDRPDGELDLKRREWHKFILNDLLPYKDHAKKWDGQGIVIVANGEKGREQIKVVLRALEKVGSKLPVEVHYYDHEFTEQDQQDILSVSKNVYFNDLKESKQNIVKTEYNAFVHNYQLKTAAVINSRFAEILLLDADNTPVIAPESLFDSGVYREYGTVFWPDIARTRPNNPIWVITNTKCVKDEYEQESGQLVVNKRKFFYHLQLAAWMNAVKQGEYYNTFLLGDKDMFRFAWHALRTTYGRPTKWVKTVGMVHEDSFCGHSFAQHHPDFWNGSVAFVHAGLTKLLPKDFLQWQQTQGGLFQSFQVASKDEDLNNVQDVGLKIDELNYWPQKPESIKFIQCNEMKQVPAQKLEEVLPKYDTFFTDIGGYTMLENYFGGKEP